MSIGRVATRVVGQPRGGNPDPTKTKITGIHGPPVGKGGRRHGVPGDLGPTLLAARTHGWRLEEASGTRYDQETPAHDFIDGVAPTSTTGKHGTAWLGNGTNQYSYFDGTHTLDTQAGCGVSLWIKPTTIPTLWIPFGINAGSSWSTIAFILQYDTGTMNLHMGGAAGQAYSLYGTSFGAMTAGNWYHIYAGYDADTDTSSIRINNGTTDTLSAVTSPTHSTTRRVHIGAGSLLGRYFPGAVDTLDWWPRPLTVAEQDYMWNGGDGVQL